MTLCTRFRFRRRPSPLAVHLAVHQELRTIAERRLADVLREPRFVVQQLRHHHSHATISVDGPVATVRMPVAA